jgi:aminopeptidase N
LVAGGVAVAAVAGLSLAGPLGQRGSADPACPPAAAAPTGTAVPAPQTPGPSFGPGSDGIGDSYYPRAGNGGYDVLDYNLDLCYDPVRRELHGTATITAVATADLTSFNLDYSGPPISSLSVNGATASRQQRDGELVVTPAVPLATGSTFTTVVGYGGQPASYQDPGLGEIGFLTSAEGVVAIGEPVVAATWFPVNDHPRDKATYTIRISAPSALAALANGVLVSRQPGSAGYTTWTWRVSSPMAPYLATMVVGTYRVSESTHDGLPVVLATHTSLPMTVDEELARTPEIVDYLETVFGPYPFDALGGIAINDPRVRFALENQTRPIYSEVFFGRDASWVIVHEQAHQWFGDSVSIHDWREIWLNEGFASYAEWLWAEHNGQATAQEIFDDSYDRGPEDPLWRVPPGDVGTDHLFRDPGSEYERGAMTLHALRVTVGDSDFFQILREWAARKKDGVATTAEFVALAEEISGEPLDQLFQDWLYGTVRPPRP